MADVDIARGWARVAGKGGRERRVPVDAQVAGFLGDLPVECIVRGYLASGLYEFVDFVLLEGGRHQALWRRLEAIINHESAVAAGERLFEDESVARLRMVAWFDPLPALHAGIHPFPAGGTGQPTSAVQA